LTGKKNPNKHEVKQVFQEEATNQKCEDFALLHEDPMYEIMKAEAEMREKIRSNPT